MLRAVFAPVNLERETIVFQLVVAVLYIALGLLGQIFAIHPGNITPVWLPSGLMFALALRFGGQVWPGIFLGAFFGNIWAYFSFEQLQVSILAIVAASFNGVGDVLAIVWTAGLVKKLTFKSGPFHSLLGFLTFILIGGVVGAFISALFGVTSLTTLGFIEWNSYIFAFSNWWIGDGVGVLLLTPLFYAFLIDKPRLTSHIPFGLLLSLPVFSLFSMEVFDLVELSVESYQVLILLTPIAFALMLYSGQKAVYIVQLCVVAVAIIATYQGKGPFIDYGYFSSLMSLQIFIAVFSMIVFSIALLVEQKRQMLEQLNQQKDELESLYRHDQLTGLWNRYRIDEYLKIDLDRYKRKQEGFSVFLIDIDDFKKVNDRYGHLAGDRVLKELSQLLEKNTRASDLVGRYGGEEFIIIAAEDDKDKAKELANKMVMLVGQNDFSLPSPVTISVGYTMCIENDTIENIVSRADKGLYQAKQQGKNQAQFHA